MSSILEIVHETCENFVELYRARACLGNNDLVGGTANIEDQSVVVLILAKTGRKGQVHSRTLVHPPSNGYRKAQHLFQIAQKFSRPVVVFALCSNSLPEFDAPNPLNSHNLTKHMFTQWHIRSPILLVVLNRLCSGDIFGVWLADKILSLEQTRFAMNFPDQGRHYCIHIGAESLLRHGIIDKTIPGAFSGTHFSKLAMIKQLRDGVGAMLKDVSALPEDELLNRRRNKLDQVTGLALKQYDQRTGSSRQQRMPGHQ